MPKTNKHITKKEVDKMRLTHIKFNFSFISKSNGLGISTLNDTERGQLLERIYFLSESEYRLKTSALIGKKLGIESIPISQMKRSCEICQDFFKEKHRNHLTQGDSKYLIFRLYTNDNPILVRIIGVKYQTIFYILFIDYNGTMYDH